MPSMPVSRQASADSSKKRVSVVAALPAVKIAGCFAESETSASWEAFPDSTRLRGKPVSGCFHPVGLLSANHEGKETDVDVRLMDPVAEQPLHGEVQAARNRLYPDKCGRRQAGP
jgi:hypothetical protein